MVMLLVSSLASLAVIGVVEYVSGRRTLMPIAAERMTQLREGQKRAIEMLFADLSNSLAIYSRGFTADEAVQAFTAGFDQLADAPTDPGQQQALESYYTDKLIKPIQQTTGQKLDLAAVLPEQQRAAIPATPLHASGRGRVAPPEDAGDGSAWSAANARFNQYFREIATRFEYRDAMLLDTRGNVVYNVNKGPGAGHQHPHRPVSRIQPAWRVRKGNGRRFGRFRLDHRFPGVPGGRRNAHRMAGVADRCGGQDERGAGASAADLEGQPDHDRRPALESRRAWARRPRPIWPVRTA